MIPYYAMPGTPHKKWSKRAKFIILSEFQEKIIDTICYYYCIDRDTLQIRSKKQLAVIHRAMTAYLLVSYGNITLADAGIFLKCHYSSIIYYRNLVKDQLSLKNSNQFKNDVISLSALIDN